MSLVSLHGIRKSYGSRAVLNDVSITVEDRDRLGLIGVNGAGKSTLLRILLGDEDADDGVITRKRGLTATFVTQNPAMDPTATVLDIVRSGLEVHEALVRRFEELTSSLSKSMDDPSRMALLEEQAALGERLTHMGAWESTHRAEAIMDALGVPAGNRTAGSLSLGEQRRLSIARGLLAQPDLLVLDEPTNHIDVKAIEWLERELSVWPSALIVVTHDRFFLDAVATRHAELDRGSLSTYDGNYTEYLAARALREAEEESREHKRQRAIESELTWVRRRAPARTTKQRARLLRFDALVATRPPPPVGESVFRIPHPRRLGKTILELKEVTKAIGSRTLIEGLSLCLKRGDRLGIVGPNGAGKTTLLRMIHGEISPDRGEIVLGQNSCIAYADQRRLLDEEKTILSEVAGESDVVWVGEEPVSVHAFLDALLFDGTAQRTKIAALSGGERSRVALAKALRVPANLLILDEPTNDLDLPTLRVLEDALASYPGCALIVSHDRYFLDRVSTGILAFEGDGRVTLYEGSYESYRARAAAPRGGEVEGPGAVAYEQRATNKRSLAEEKKRGGGEERETSVGRGTEFGAGQGRDVDAGRRSEGALAEVAPASASEPRRKKVKRTFAEEREFQSMEAHIIEAEAEVSSLESELSDPARLKDLGPGIGARIRCLEEARKRVEALYDRWAELSKWS